MFCVHIVKNVCFFKNVFEFITANSGLTSGSKRVMTVVLLGKISNKCLVGNNIFQKDHFRSEKVSCEKIVDNVDGKKVCIINTPDLFNKPSSSDQEADSMEELKPSYEGPRVFLLILQDRRVSPEEMEMFTELKKKLGQKMVEQTIVLVNSDTKVSSNSIDKSLSFRKDFNIILNECGNKMCVYSKHTKNTELIKELMKYTEIKNQTSETDRVRYAKQLCIVTAGIELIYKYESLFLFQRDT